MTQSIEPSFLNLTQTTEPFFHKWLEDLNFLLQICLIEILKMKKKRWLEELIFWKYQSKYRNFILMTQRIEFFFLTNMTHGTEPFFPCDSRNWTLLSNMTHSNWILLFFDMTQRIEPFLEYDSKSCKIFMSFWLKELNLFWIWLENLNFFSWMWLTELNFLWLKELSFFQYDKDFVEYDSKNRTFVWICPIELNLFWNFTQWIEHFAQKDSKNWTLKDYLNNKTFLWLGELGLFFYLTQRIEFFLKNITQLLTFFWHHSQNWTPF